jgi:hypothetical protein
MNPTLRPGATGPQVKTLQANLNRLPSALPPLATDAVFGPKTAARVRELQIAQRLTGDGVVGTLTWNALAQLLGQLLGSVSGVAASVGPVVAADAARPAILATASSLVGTVDFLVLEGGRPRGIDRVKEFFLEATGTTVVDEQFRGSKGEWQPAPLIDGGRKDWCAIFVVFCYRRAGLLQIRWDLKSGRPVGPLALTTFSSRFVQNIRPGNMGLVNFNNHHFLIESVAEGGPVPLLQTIDGNTTAGRIIKRKEHRVGQDNFNYYQFT